MLDSNANYDLCCVVRGGGAGTGWNELVMELGVRCSKEGTPCWHALVVASRRFTHGLFLLSCCFVDSQNRRIILTVHTALHKQALAARKAIGILDRYELPKIDARERGR